MMRPEGPGTMLDAADQIQRGGELADFILPYLDCALHVPVYQQHSQAQKTTMQDVTITGKISGTSLPAGSVLWLPERGYRSCFLMAPVAQATSVTLYNSIVASTQQNTQVFVGAQQRFIQIEPNLTLNFSIGRSTHGVLHLFSSAQSVTSTTLNGLVSAGNLSDYRDMDFANGAQLAQNSGQNSSDGVPQAYLSDGISMLQGPDTKNTIGIVSEREGYPGDDNGYLQFPYAGDGITMAGGASLWIGDAVWGVTNATAISVNPGFGPFARIIYDLRYYLLTIAAQPATAWTRLTLTVTHYYAQYNPGDVQPLCIFALTEIKHVDSGMGDTGLYAMTTSIEVPDVFRAAQNQTTAGAFVIQGTLQRGDGACASYIGTQIFHAYKATGVSVITSYNLKSVTVKILGQLKAGTIGPARVVSYSGAGGQDITIVGKQYWQLVATNASAPYIKSGEEKQETPEARHLLNWLFDGAPVPIFRRVYVRTQWVDTVEMLRREGVETVLARLKVRAEQLDNIRSTLKASAAGLFSNLGGMLGNYLFPGVGGKVGNLLGQGVDSVAGTAGGLSRANSSGLSHAWSAGRSLKRHRA